MLIYVIIYPNKGSFLLPSKDSSGFQVLRRLLILTLTLTPESCGILFKKAVFLCDTSSLNGSRR